MNTPYDAAHPTKTAHPASYPRPKCDPKKSIIYTTTAAANPEFPTDPSFDYRGSRPHRPPVRIPKHPTQSLYPTSKTATPTQHESHSQQQQQQQHHQAQTTTTSIPTMTTSSSPFIAHPSPRLSRYPQHPHSQVRSVCSPAARIANPYAFDVHRATHTKH